MFPVGGGIVLNPHMAQGVFLPVGGVVKGLGGVHVAVALRNEQGLVHIRRHVFFRLHAGGHAVVGKVVEGVHVLQKMALGEVPDPEVWRLGSSLWAMALVRA